MKEATHFLRNLGIKPTFKKWRGTFDFLFALETLERAPSYLGDKEEEVVQPMQACKRSMNQ